MLALTFGEESWANIKGRFWDLLSFWTSGEAASLLLDERWKGKGILLETLM